MPINEEIEVIQRLHDLLNTTSPYDKITIISNKFTKAEQWQTFILSDFVKYILIKDKK